MAHSAAATTVSGEPRVTVTWSKSADEGAGEKDVERYSIFRRRPAGAFSEPIASIPAGTANYSFVDTDVGEAGEQWVYGVTTQDCTPSVSPMGATGTVTVPPTA